MLIVHAPLLHTCTIFANGSSYISPYRARYTGYAYHTTECRDCWRLCVKDFVANLPILGHPRGQLCTPSLRLTMSRIETGSIGTRLARELSHVGMALFLFSPPARCPSIPLSRWNGTEETKTSLSFFLSIHTHTHTHTPHNSIPFLVRTPSM